MKIKIGMVIFLLLFLSGMVKGEEAVTYKLEEVVVTEEKKEAEVTYSPEKTTINIDACQTAGASNFIEDIIKAQPILDYRGASDLSPGGVTTRDNTIWMRGFTSYRFVTAIDGSNLQKTGGRNSYIVDYSLLPSFLFEKVEILPGPHSALYPGKSIGGVVNLITRTPERYDTLKPTVKSTTGYKSYGTYSQSTSVRGGAGDFIYDAGYQKYATNGYLRNSAVDMDTFSGRVGYILPSDGYISFTVTNTNANREVPTKNDSSLDDYDNSYPEVTASSFYQWQNPEYDETSASYRLNYNQETPVGLLDLNMYYSEEDRERDYLAKKSSGDTYDASWEAKWHQQGGKIQDTIEFSDSQTSTVGAELEQCFDRFDGPSYSTPDKKRVEIISGFAQHQWNIIPRLTLTAGLRYEHVDAWIDNLSVSTGELLITGESRWIERSWDGWLPKSFLTYELDNLAPGLRDTSVSLGVSRIWRAPINFGEFNPRQIPTGAWLEAEHGVGYDLVLSRRIVNDIQLKADYSYYEIKDYIAWNWDYAEYTPSSNNPVTSGMEYKDYCINLDKVIRHGIEIQLSGHILDDLSFYCGYAYQTFDSKGGEPAGEAELDDFAKNRVNAGLRYDLFENTQLLLDYKYQDEQVIQKGEEVTPGVWEFSKIAIDAYHIFDLACEQRLFKNWGVFKDGEIKLYINNLFDNTYENLSGYPATDRTYGISLSFSL